jgi:hypothetical protein
MVLMPHFVVTLFHGKRHYAVEFDYQPKLSNGVDRWPLPIDVIEITDEVATYSMQILINAYEHGIRPKRKTDISPLLLTTNAVYGKMVLPAPDQSKTLLAMG